MLNTNFLPWLSATLTFFLTFSTATQTPLETPTKFPWIQNFASIGDSYAAGLGSGSRLDWSCSRYSKSYPNILHTALLGDNANRTHQFLACSGATTTEVLEKQIPALTQDVDVLTISAGGNDIGLTPILSACIFQFYLDDAAACNASLAAAHALLANETQLFNNVSLLLAAASPKLNPAHGRIYYTGYATFFAADDTACDTVSWALWRRVSPTPTPHLSLGLRAELNALVRSANAIIAAAVRAAGPHAQFVDYDAQIAAQRGRFCEPGVSEPAPNRKALAFYEWDTVDVGEDAGRLLNGTGGDVREGSFEGEIARLINRTLEACPGCEVEEGKGWIDRDGTRGVGRPRKGVEDEGVVGDTLHWLIPDSYKRVFHLRPSGHEIVAGLVLGHLERREGREGDGDERLEL